MFEVKLISDALKGLAPTRVDDFVDKAHYLITCALLLFFGLVLGAKQIFGEPISCLVPGEYDGTWGKYVNNYCFVANTYVVEGAGESMLWDEDKMLPGQVKVDISYYPWVPYLFVVQAALFYTPHLLWLLYQKSQTHLSFEHIVKECMASREMSIAERDEKLGDVADGLTKTHEFCQIKEHRNGLGKSGYVVYVLSKILNACNLLVQLYFLSKIVGQGSYAWGKNIVDYAVDDVFSNVTGYFPRVALCPFKQNMLANLQYRTVQCAMMANMITEKMFVILYGVFILLLVATLLNICYLVFMYGIRRHQTASRYLKTPANKNVKGEAFATEQLGYDGLLLLRFIENNAGFLVASKVASKFYARTN